MSADQLIPLDFAPGIQRDGTRLDTDCAVDALWCRWRNRRPRKMFGYKSLLANMDAAGRRVHMFYLGDKVYAHIGTGKSLLQIVLNQSGEVLSTANRTPDIYPSGPDAGWTLDAIFDTTSSVTQLVAHSTPNIGITATATKTIPYIGDITTTDKLVPLNYTGSDTEATYDTPEISGGIACIQPILFSFDSDGGIGWSAPNLPNTLGVHGGSSGAGRARVSAQKIIAGMPIRGGGANSPAGIFWSLSEVIIAQYVGNPVWFAFSTISPSSSILSAQSVIEYDGLYYWAGIDRFLCFNGTVREVPNKYNADWFFDNMNWSQSGKAFAFKVPRFGEIWFCAPLFGATEPSHAVIYNVRENCWYDTELPNGGRSAAYFAQGFPYPIMSGCTAGSDGYSLWLHEYGFDQVVGDVITPIQSYFETPVLGGSRGNPPISDGVSCGTMEPDFVQSGALTANVTGGWNARSGDAPGEIVSIPEQPGAQLEQIASFKDSRRQPRIHVESNVLGGNYIAGRSLLHIQKGDGKITGGPAGA